MTLQNGIPFCSASFFSSLNLRIVQEIPMNWSSEELALLEYPPLLRQTLAIPRHMMCLSTEELQVWIAQFTLKQAFGTPAFAFWLGALAAKLCHPTRIGKQQAEISAAFLEASKGCKISFTEAQQVSCSCHSFSSKEFHVKLM